MEPKLINVEKLPAEVQHFLIPYLKDLINIHKDNLICVFIYGSATGKSYWHKISNINSGLILKRLDAPALTASLKIISQGLSHKIIAPLFLTKEYIQSSLDVFPIEFFEMKENVFPSSEISLANAFKDLVEKIKNYTEFIGRTFFNEDNLFTNICQLNGYIKISDREISLEIAEGSFSTTK